MFRSSYLAWNTKCNKNLFLIKLSNNTSFSNIFTCRDYHVFSYNPLHDIIIHFSVNTTEFLLKNIVYVLYFVLNFMIDI